MYYHYPTKSLAKAINHKLEKTTQPKNKPKSIVGITELISKKEVIKSRASIPTTDIICAPYDDIISTQLNSLINKIISNNKDNLQTGENKTRGQPNKTNTIYQKYSKHFSDSIQNNYSQLDQVAENNITIRELQERKRRQRGKYSLLDDPEYTINSSLGHTLATLNNTGNLNSSNSVLHRTGPFGEVITQTGVLGGVNNAKIKEYANSAERRTETDYTLKFITMGARLYIPVLGRFTSVDPIKGGTQNDYVYPGDPINGNDFSGKGADNGFYAIFASVVAVAVRTVVAINAALFAYDVVDCVVAGNSFACGTASLSLLTAGETNIPAHAAAAAVNLGMKEIVGADKLANLAGTKKISINGLVNTAQIAEDITEKGLTVSSLTLGRQMHTEFMAENVDEINGFYKEFTRITGIRPDFVHIDNQSMIIRIFEYKPNNPNSITKGLLQLQNYEGVFLTVEKYKKYRIELHLVTY
jgi:RHS repeat-associated protein